MTARRKGLASKWRSKPSNHQLALHHAQCAIDLIPARCQDFGPTLAHEELVGPAREGRMQADVMIGGTFTINNLGMFGVEDFVAIINPPQAAILALGAVKGVPVVTEEGELVVGARMKATISVRHRVSGGRGGPVLAGVRVIGRDGRAGYC